MWITNKRFYINSPHPPPPSLMGFKELQNNNRYQGNGYSRFSINFEANASESLENLNEIFKNVVTIINHMQMG